MRILRTLLGRGKSYISGVNDMGELDSGFSKWSKQYANLPERYLLRKSRKLLWKGPPGLEYRQGIILSRIPEYDMKRPWTHDYWQTQERFPKAFSHTDYAEPIRDMDWMWFKGDRVEVLVGKDKGKQGIINYVVQERNWVCVEGLNCEYVTQGATKDFPGIVQAQEQPLTVTTDIKLVDPEDELVTEVEWMYTEGGERVRVSKRSGKILPIPKQAYETIDYKNADGYMENKDKDTKAADVEDITFDPKLATFEMELMELYNIKEDRIPQKTYWY